MRIDRCRMLSVLTFAAALTIPAAMAQRDGLLDAHNELRSRHGVPPLAWSQSLEGDAQSWADKCVVEHSKNRDGENLAWWRGGNRTAVDFVRAWYAEIKDFDFSDPDRNDYQVSGHFSQMIWRESRKLGCGVSACPDGAKMLVCRYSPRGNVKGQFRDNVPPPE